MNQIITKGVVLSRTNFQEADRILTVLTPDYGKVRVVAKGANIQTWINGAQVANLTHEEIYKSHPKGFFGLQVHGIKAGSGPFQVAWKNIRIKELK